MPLGPSKRAAEPIPSVAPCMPFPARVEAVYVSFPKSTPTWAAPTPWKCRVTVGGGPPGDTAAVTSSEIQVGPLVAEMKVHESAKAAPEKTTLPVGTPCSVNEEELAPPVTPKSVVLVCLGLLAVTRMQLTPVEGTVNRAATSTSRTSMFAGPGVVPLQAATARQTNAHTSSRSRHFICPPVPA